MWVDRFSSRHVLHRNGNLGIPGQSRPTPHVNLTYASSSSALPQIVSTSDLHLVPLVPEPNRNALAARTIKNIFGFSRSAAVIDVMMALNAAYFFTVQIKGSFS